MPHPPIVLFDFDGVVLTQKALEFTALIYSRKEVFVSSRTRHPMRIKMKSGIKKDGTITAIDYQVLMNTGALGSHALTVLSNAGSKVLPLFNKVQNIRFNADSVYTNLPVGGAYRGYGVTQSVFAYGQQIDMMARAIGMDVVDFYLKHHIQRGETSPIFQALGEGKAGVEMTITSCGLADCLKKGAAAIGWKQKRDKHIKNGSRVRGVGMVGLMQGSAIPEIDMGAASMKMNEDGSFNLLIGATDLGTGSDTILAQIAAEVLSIPIDNIIVLSSDTDVTPFDSGAYASSTTYLSGEAIRKCALKIRQQIYDVASEMSHVPAGQFNLAEEKVVADSIEISLADICNYAMYQKNQFQIQASASHITHQSPPPFSAHFTEVEVDTETGQVNVLNYVAAVDCGVAINPALAEGQVEGAVVNGLSYALTEEYYFNSKGAMTNPSFGRYKIYTAPDVPKIQIILIQTHEPTGPFGAKSIAEIGINGPLPAVANAIHDAVGVRLFKAPFTAERVYRAMNVKKPDLGG